MADDRYNVSLDYSDYVAKQTTDFTGREWVFRKIDDWLTEDDPPIFLLTGLPGSGKTALAARLVQMSQGQVPASHYPHLGSHSLKYYHFCQTLRNSTLDPLRFIENLSRTLAKHFQHFAYALTQLGDQNIKINVEQKTGTVEGGGQIAGVVIEALHIGNLSPRIAFDRVVRRPLEALYGNGFDEPIVILVDSLDESLTYDEENNIARLLGDATDLPRQVRFLLTSRPNDQVQNIIGKSSLDLIDDTPDGAIDVLRYAAVRLSSLPEPRRNEIAARIATAANGNFLYTRYVLDDLLPQIDQVADLSNLPLPKDLQDQYRGFLKRELGRSLKQWAKDYRPLLGLIAVARGQGLTHSQLAGLTGRSLSETGNILSACHQYLAGPQPDGLFRIYHQSFREFLFSDETFKVEPAEANRAIGEFFVREYAGEWLKCEDTYALQYTPMHLIEAARQTGTRILRKELSASLVGLLTDFDFLEAKCRTVSVSDLETDYRLALAGDPGDPAEKEVLQAFEERLRLEAHHIQRAPELLFPHLYNHLVWLDAPQAPGVTCGPIYTRCVVGQTGRTGWLRLLQDPRPAPPPWQVAFEVHMGHVTAVAVSDDGQYAVSACEDQRLRLWELASGRLIRVYAGHTAAVHAVAITAGPAGLPGSQLVSGAYDGTLKLWDLATGRPVRSLQAHTAPVIAVALAPGGKLFLSASADRTLKLWELPTGRLVRAFEGHTAALTAAVITSDGRWVISAAEDHTLKVWDFATGRLIRSLFGHTAAVTALAADDQLAVSADEDGEIRLWYLDELLTSVPADGEAAETAEPPVEAADGWLCSRAASTYRLLTGINAVALLPDARRAVVGFGSGELELRDLDSDELVLSFAGHNNPVTTVAVTPDGSRLVSGSWDESLKLWDLPSGGLVRALSGHTWSVTAIAITLDGQLMVSGSRDNMLKLWELSSGRLLRTFEGHTANVSTLALTPDSRHILSAGFDRVLRLWELATGRLVRVLGGHTANVKAVAVTPDGRYAVSGGWDRSLGLWELESGRLVYKVEGHTEGIDAVAVTPDGRYVVSGSSDNTLKLWDLASGSLLHTFTGHDKDVNTVVVTPDGQHAVSGSRDHTVRLWELPAGRLIRTLEGHTNIVTAVAVTPDGRHVVSGSLDETFRLWDLASGRLLHIFEIATENVHALAVTPAGQGVVVGSGHQHLRLWDLSARPARRALAGHSDKVHAVAVTPDGQQILSASFDRTLRLWDGPTGRLVRTYQGHHDRVTAVAITPDGQYAVSGSADETVRVWELATGRLLRTIDAHDNRVWTVALTPNGLYAVSGSRDYTVKLWELATGRCVHTFEGHTANVTSVAVTPNGRFAVSGSRDRTFKVWELASGRLVRSVDAHPKVVSAVAITLDGQQLVTGSHASLKVWELASGRELAALTGHTDWVTTLAVTPDGQHLISGSADQTLRLWHLTSGYSRVLFGNDEAIQSVALAPRGTWLACGDAHGRVWMFEWVK